MQKQKTMRYQTSDYLDFDTATALVRKLYREEKYALSLLIGCGIFFGLRISDILSLRWEQLLNEDDKFVIYEKKTKKRRTIKINAQFKPHILACYEAIHPRSLDRPCFISQKHGVYSVQRINVLLKDIMKKYNLKIEHFSTHSLRKTFGRKIFELTSSQGQGELALIKLSELFNHSNASITRIYLGIKEEEMLSTYDMLEF